MFVSSDTEVGEEFRGLKLAQDKVISLGPVTFLSFHGTAVPVGHLVSASFQEFLFTGGLE